MILILVFQNLDVWYEAHVSYPGYNNYGYYIPTIPFPLIGHDDFKAWGMTMFENDEVDLYKEIFNPKNKNQVLFDGKCVNSQVIKEQIKVKGKSHEDLNIRVTSHGPIISDYIDGYTGSPLAFSWVFYNLENPFFDMFFMTLQQPIILLISNILFRKSLLQV